MNDVQAPQTPSPPVPAGEVRAQPIDFDGVFERELGYVCRTLQRFGVRAGDVPDVAQDVFVEVHRHWARYDAARPVRPWLFMFCLHAGRNYQRLARHRFEAHVEVEHQDGQQRTDQRSEQRELVLRALEHVELERRAVLLLHDVEGHSAVEIAELTAIPINTVYSRLRLARGELERAVRELTGNES